MAEKNPSASEIIAGKLEEPWDVKDMPKWPGWVAMFGPGLVWAGLSQGSGELIWWPYMVAKYGTYFLGWMFIWASLQYWVNLEIARYSIATGESIYEGFHRIHHLFGWLIFVMVIIVSFWIGGYISAGATALKALTNFPPGWSDKAQTHFWAELCLIIVFILFLLGPVAYRIVEVVESIAAIASFFGMLVIVIAAPAVHAVVGEFFAALFTPHIPLTPPNWDPADTGKLVTLICYTGAGGFWNLYYSFWVRDKNAGMSALIGRVTSPITGKPEPIPGVGVAFTEKDIDEWKAWVKWLWCDNAFGVILNTLTIVLTSLLSLGILHPEGLIPTGFDIVVIQGEWFAELWGAAGRNIFYVLGFFFLADTYLTGLDGISRTVASNIYTNVPQTRKIEYRKLYYIVVTIFTVIAMYQVIAKRPGVLLVLTGVGNMLIMCIYCVGLLYLNWFLLPKIHPAKEKVRPTWIPFIFLLISTLIFWYVFFVMYLPLQFK
jgi:hypothetical protein